MKRTNRYFIAVLCSIGFMIVFCFEINIRAAMPYMLNHTALNSYESISSKSCKNTTKIVDGPFHWGFIMQYIIIFTYFGGFILLQLPFGILTEKCSPKRLLFATVATNIACTLLTPAFVIIHYGAFVLLRLIEGISMGFVLPSLHLLIAHWSQPHERGFFGSIVYGSSALGVAITIQLSELISEYLNWEYVFYIPAWISSIWLPIWFILVTDNPTKYRYMSKLEKFLIENALNDELEVDGITTIATKPKKLPWKKILTCSEFWGIFIGHLCSNCSWYIILFEIPNYMKNDIGILRVLPYYTMWLFSLIISKVLDIYIGKKIITKISARKIAVCISTIIPSICFLCVPMFMCQVYPTIVFLTIGIGFSGAKFCGFFINHIDISPNYCGILIGITNTAATIPAILVPLFAKKINQLENSIKCWRLIFWSATGFYLIEVTMYLLLASGDVQSWNHEIVNIEQQPPPDETTVNSDSERSYTSVFDKVP